MKPLEFQKVCKGVFVMMTTPFKENRDVDLEGVKKHTRYLIDKGIKTGTGVLVPVGSTGECPMLSTEETKMIMKAVIEEAGDEVPVMTCCNSTDTRVAIELAKYSQEIGAAGIMMSPHYYWKPTDGMLMAHFGAVAAEVDLGIVVDNIEFATGVDITIPQFQMLKEAIPQIIGIKENKSDIGKWDEECRLFGDSINFISGNADCHWPYVGLIGSVGMISAMSNFIPDRVLKIWEAVQNDDYVEAKRIHRELMPISLYNSRVASEEYKSFIKEIMNLMGIPAGPTRLPMVPLNAETKASAREVCEKMGLI